MTAALRDRPLSIGADPRDTADERFRKRLLVGVALVILPIGFLWGCLYWGVGEHAVALTPWAYVIGSAISLVVFARTRDFAFAPKCRFWELDLFGLRGASPSPSDRCLDAGNHSADVDRDVRRLARIGPGDERVDALLAEPGNGQLESPGKLPAAGVKGGHE
jgi:hypothetical protein